VDSYGECDEGLARGNPLHLESAMYEDLVKVWINNDIPGRIARTFDPEVLIIRADWFTL
jgi:hypothetical protein